MAATYKVVTGVLGDTASETKDFTSAGFGTPTGALILVTNANSSSNPQVNAAFTIAFWDGTNLRSSAFYSGSVLDISATARAMSTTTIDCKFTTNTYFAQYTVSNITDGIRLTMSYDNTGVERYATVVLFGGSADVDVFTFTPHGTQNSSASKTGLAYRPSLVFFAGCGGASGVNEAAGMLSYGVVVDDGSNTQRAVLVGSVDNVDTSVTNRRLETNSVGGQLYNDALTWTGEVAITNDGFDMTTRDGASGGDDLYCMAVGLDGQDAWLGTLTTPTSTGNNSITAPGFMPALALLSSVAVAIDTSEAGNQFNVGATDGIQTRHLSVRDEDNQGTTDTDSEMGAGLVQMRSTADGSDTVLATLVSFDATGRTYTYSAVLPLALYGWELLLESPSVTGNPWYAYAQM